MEECESKYGIFWTFVNRACHAGGDSGCSLEDIIIFFSGADGIPPLGFNHSPSLHFLETDAVFPTSSTCSLQLRLPTQYNTYETFKDAMKEVLFGNGGRDGGPYIHHYVVRI